MKSIKVIPTAKALREALASNCEADTRLEGIEPVNVPGLAGKIFEAEDIGNGSNIVVLLLPEGEAITLRRDLCWVLETE